METKKEDLCRRSVFILDKFEGPCYDFLESTNATVLGPMCLTTCILSDIIVPKGKIYTCSMQGMIISASGLNTAEKVRLVFIIFFAKMFLFATITYSTKPVFSDIIFD